MVERFRPLFPFTALVGQDQMKRALLLNAANPRLGGVLVRGQKGTAKSTAVRALAALLPEIEVIADCRFNCDPHGGPRCDDCTARAEQGPLPSRRRRVPIVDLPLGATEDRVVGTLDLERALQSGERRFEPGLLAAANRGILYVDEVNLLGDHLVDVLLDAASLGVNYVEREGLSFSHPAELMLVGTMNPEEGDLRPQLLDRFALAVEVGGLPNPVERAEVVRRRIAFERDPVAFVAHWAEAEEAERERVRRARALLPRVELDDGLLDLIARLCASFEVDGLRADIVLYKAATTLAAYAGRTRVAEGDVRVAAELALVHRRRRQPFERPGLDQERLDQAIQEHRREQGTQPGQDGEGGQGQSDDQNADDQNADDPNAADPTAPVTSASESPTSDSAQASPTSTDTSLSTSPDASTSPGASANESSDRDGPAAPDRVDAPADPLPLRLAAPPRGPGASSGSLSAGRGRRVRQTGGQGAYVASVASRGPLRDLALDATLRAAAPHQVARRGEEALTLTLSRARERGSTAGDRPPFVTTSSVGEGLAPSQVLCGSSDDREEALTLAQRFALRGAREETATARPLVRRGKACLARAGDACVAPTNDEAPRSPLPRRGGGQGEGRLLILRRWDFRQKVRETRAGSAVLFVVDASGSMAAQRRMAAVKGAILALLLDAYQRRDQVGLIAFRGGAAELVLPLSASTDLAEAHLRVMPTGGRTPLAHALYLAAATLRRQRATRPDDRPLLVLVTDGRANVPLGEGDPLQDARAAAETLALVRVDVLVVDTESGVARLGLARDLATRLEARYVRLDELSAETLANAVQAQRG